MTKRFLVAVAVPIVCAAACDDAPTSHQYVAMVYEPPADASGAGCLEPSDAIDVVPGGDGNMLCAPACLVPKAPNDARVFVSPMCPPYPDWLDASGSDARCAGALSAWQAYTVNPLCECGADCSGDDDAGDDANNGDDDAATSDASTNDAAHDDGATPGDGGAE